MNNSSSRFTPIDDSDSSCERTEVTLGIYNIDPEIVSQKLCLTPTSSQKTGIPRTMPSGKVRIGTTNSWVLSSELSGVMSKDIRTHLNWLLNKLKPVLDQLKELQQMPETKMFIACTWWSAEGGGGPTLWPEQMQQMADLNLECNFNFAYYGDNAKQ